MTFFSPQKYLGIPFFHYVCLYTIQNYNDTHLLHMKTRICIQNVWVYFGYIALFKNFRNRESCFHQLITVCQIFQTAGSLSEVHCKLDRPWRSYFQGGFRYQPEENIALFLEICYDALLKRKLEHSLMVFLTSNLFLQTSHGSHLSRSRSKIQTE